MAKMYLSEEEALEFSKQGVEVHIDWGVSYEDGFAEDVFRGYYIEVDLCDWLKSTTART